MRSMKMLRCALASVEKNGSAVSIVSPSDRKRRST
jgi:hypothetical protein